MALRFQSRSIRGPVEAERRGFNNKPLVRSVILGSLLAISFSGTAMASHTDGRFRVLSVSCINESPSQKVCGMQLDSAIIPSGPRRCTSQFVFWHLNNDNKVLLDLAITAHLEQRDIFVVHDGCIDNTQGNFRPKVVGIQVE